MTASKVIIINTQLDANALYKKDGYITQVNSSDSFEMEGINILVQLNTKFINGVKSDLKTNKHIIIKGFTNSESVLLADEIYLVDRKTQIVLEGFIDSIETTNKKVVVLGKEIIIDDVTRTLKDDRENTMIDIDFNQLNVGDFVYIEAYNKNNNTTFNAFYLSKVQPQLSFRAMSVVKNSTNQQEIILFSNHILIDDITLFFDISAKPLSKTEFFAQIKDGETLLDVYGLHSQPSSIMANVIYIDSSW